MVQTELHVLGQERISTKSTIGIISLCFIGLVLLSLPGPAMVLGFVALTAAVAWMVSRIGYRVMLCTFGKALYTVAVVVGMTAMMVFSLVASTPQAVGRIYERWCERRKARRLSIAQYRRNARSLAGTTWW